jgi:hypothetical protein
MTYDTVSHTLRQPVPLPKPASAIVIADEQHVYMGFGGKEDRSGVPCHVSGATIGRVDLGTGSVETLWTLGMPPGPNDMVLTPNNTLLILDRCFTIDHARLTVLDPATGVVQAHTRIKRSVALHMSPVTSQGEIAIFLEDGHVQWYDATTLEPRGQSTVPVDGWIQSALLYPPATMVGN